MEAKVDDFNKIKRLESFINLAENDSATLRKELKTANAIARDIKGKPKN